MELFVLAIFMKCVNTKVLANIIKLFSVQGELRVHNAYHKITI